MTYYPVVVQALAGKDQEIYVYFSDGHIRRYDMKPLIASGGVFNRLKDNNFFKERLTVMNGTAAWDLTGSYDPTSCIDVDPFELYGGIPVADPLEKAVSE